MERRRGRRARGQPRCATSFACRIGASLALLLPVLTPAAAQTNDTGRQFWPEMYVHDQLSSDLRFLAFAGLKEGEETPYQQWNVGAGIGFQWRRFTIPHVVDIDSDKENFLVAGLGYEYLRTIQSGKESQEDRGVVEVTPRIRPPGGFLVADRNRVEFRWVDGDYSTRYRTRLTVGRETSANGFRFTPYGSAEFFYDMTKGTWQKEQYAGGFLLPIERLLQVGVYYLRQNCPSCSPSHLNVIGLNVDLFLGRK